MSRCNNAELVNKLATQKLTQQTEVSFNVLSDLEACTTFNFRDATMEGTGTSVYNAYLVPDDMFQCLPRGCTNAGTLQAENSPSSKTTIRFSIPTDATEFAAGVVTFYVYATAAGTKDINFTIQDFAGGSNSHTYLVSVTAVSPGFVPIVINLAEAPDSEIGTGWTASTAGISGTISTPVLEQYDEAGDKPIESATALTQLFVSTLRIFDSLENFHNNEVVKLGCVDDISGDLTVDATDSTCLGATYDPNTPAVEKTITARMVTPNWEKLSPLARSGEATVGWITNTVKRVVQEETRGGVKFGSIQLVDMNLQECGFIFAQLSDTCNVVDGQLTRLTVPTEVSLLPREFSLLSGNVSTADRGKILLNADLIGQSINLSYPRQVNVEELVFDGRDMNSRRVRMSYNVTLTDGTQLNRIYDNVLITSFPDTITTEETTFAFTISAQRDLNTRAFARQYRVIS